MHHIASTFPNILVLGAAGVSCGYAALQFARSLLARRWPIVDGEVVDARIVHTGASQSRDFVGSAVRYRYHVDGETYSGDRVRFGQLAPTSWIPARNHPNAAAALAHSYPRGKTVRVYYNPRRPEDSVLRLTPDFRVWVILAAGVYLAFAVVHGGVWPMTALR